MTPDPRLLLSATRALLEGWCGPGLLDNEPVLVDGDNGCVIRLDGTLVEYDTSYLPVVFDTDMRPCGTLSLPLSRAECRDRVARVVADRMGLLRDGAKPVCTAPDWTTRFGLPHWTMAGPQFGNGGGGSSLTWIPSEGFCDELADLDPNDDTRLSDGSRLVDALALVAVARQVLTADGVPRG